MIKRLQTKPFYLLFLPVFFLLHTIQENYDLITLKSALYFFGIYCLMTVVTYAVSYLFFRDHRKASVITILWMSFFFFYSAFHEFLKTYSPIELLGKYVFVLPFSVMVLILLFIYLKKTNKRFERFSILLNVLFILYIILDTAILLWKMENPRKHNISVYDFPEIENAKIPDTVKKPDIYFLLFDEYAGSKSLKEEFGFTNDIDDYLREKGFKIQYGSHSNYNFTAFSMSSILNMAYLKNFNTESATANDYVGCNYLIKHNRVTAFLSRNGYEIVNYSVFDLQQNPALVQQFFLPQSEKIISERTFFNRINADIGWNLYTKLNLPINPKKTFFKHAENNNLFIERVKNTARQNSPRPRFIYLHLYLPHPPFFYDRNGKTRDPKVSFRQLDYFNPRAYLDYVQFTNGKLKDVVNSIQQSNPNAVIILMADHGYRKPTKDPYPLFHFNNLNAVYFPNKDYSQIYNDVTGCNQFRAVFNSIFKMNFPLLNDSSILIKDKVNH